MSLTSSSPIWLILVLVGCIGILQLPLVLAQQDALVQCDPDQVFYTTQWLDGPIPVFLLKPLPLQDSEQDLEKAGFLAAQTARITFFHYQRAEGFLKKSKYAGNQSPRGDFNLNFAHGFHFDLKLLGEQLPLDISTASSDRTSTSEEEDMMRFITEYKEQSSETENQLQQENEEFALPLGTILGKDARSLQRIIDYGNSEELANVQHNMAFAWYVGHNAHHVILNLDVQQCKNVKGRWIAYSIAINLPSIAPVNGRFELTPIDFRGRLMEQAKLTTKLFKFSGILGQRYSRNEDSSHVGVFEKLVTPQATRYQPALPSHTEKFLHISYDVIFDSKTLNDFMKGFWIKSSTRVMKLVFHQFKNLRHLTLDHMGVRVILMGPNGFQMTIMDVQDRDRAELRLDLKQSVFPAGGKIQLAESHFRNLVTNGQPPEWSPELADANSGIQSHFIGVRHPIRAKRDFLPFRFDTIVGSVSTYAAWILLPETLPSGQYHFKFQNYHYPVQAANTIWLDRETLSNGFFLLSTGQLQRQLQSFPLRDYMSEDYIHSALDDEDEAVVDSEIPAAPPGSEVTVTDIRRINGASSRPAFSITNSKTSDNSVTRFDRQKRQRFTLHPSDEKSRSHESLIEIFNGKWFGF